MGHYVGTMPTTLLNDRQIRTRSWRKWEHVQREFSRRDKDQQILADLRMSLAAHGQRDPVTLGIDDRTFTTYLENGHHRSLIFMELGIPEFTFQWHWIRSFGVHLEHKPFPFHHLGL